MVELTGRLTLGRESQQVEDPVQDLLKDGVRHMVYDLANLAYADSTGIGIIAFSARQVRKSGGEVRIAGARGGVMESLKVSGLDQIMGLDGSADEATQGFASTSGAS